MQLGPLEIVRLMTKSHKNQSAFEVERAIQAKKVWIKTGIPIEKHMELWHKIHSWTIAALDLIVIQKNQRPAKTLQSMTQIHNLQEWEEWPMEEAHLTVSQSKSTKTQNKITKEIEADQRVRRELLHLARQKILNLALQKILNLKSWQNNIKVTVLKISAMIVFRVFSMPLNKRKEWRTWVSQRHRVSNQEQKFRRNFRHLNNWFERRHSQQNQDNDQFITYSYEVILYQIAKLYLSNFAKLKACSFDSC